MKPRNIALVGNPPPPPPPMPPEVSPSFLRKLSGAALEVVEELRWSFGQPSYYEPATQEMLEYRNQLYRELGYHLASVESYAKGLGTVRSEMYFPQRN